jgi:tetratricopeptide (TPR) repeat protein
VLVTCRYLPAGTPIEQPNVLHVPLSDFLLHDVIKFLRRERRVDERLSRGELDEDLVTRLYTEFGGTPGFLEQARMLLAGPNLDVDALRDELEGLEPGRLEEKRQAYYEKIVTRRLFAALSADARRVTARLALSLLPLPPDGAAAIAGLDEAAAGRALDSGVEYGLLQRFDAPEGPSLFQPPGLLRRWLTDVERLPNDEAAETHRRLAAFWQDAYERGREAELRVHPGLELEACRHHGRLGGDVGRWRWAACRLARHLERITEWRRAYELIEEIPESLRDGACWHHLATIDLNEGHYAAAREKFGKSLSIMQAIGDKAGEAATWQYLAAIDIHEGNYTAASEKLGKSLSMRQAIADKAGEAVTWHNLATIDLEEGHYSAAREKFGKALSKRQDIGDRAGEAATWHQLATIDLNEGHYAAAREKSGKALSIAQAIGYKPGEAASWNKLAWIDLKEGNYAAAREKFGKVLSIEQAIGDKAREAATWHNLATIDLNEGNYAAGCQKFAKALSMRQAIGNKAGEASTWFQLGVTAWRAKDFATSLTLMAIGWRLARSIGLGDAKTMLTTLIQAVGQLGMDQAEFERMVERAWAEYQSDRGAGLLKKLGLTPSGAEERPR